MKTPAMSMADIRALPKGTAIKLVSDPHLVESTIPVGQTVTVEGKFQDEYGKGFKWVSTSGKTWGLMYDLAGRKFVVKK